MTITLRADAQPSATPYKTLDRAQIELGFVHAVKNAGRKIGRRGKALGLMDLPALCGSLQNYFGHVRFDSRVGWPAGISAPSLLGTLPAFCQRLCNLARAFDEKPCHRAQRAMLQGHDCNRRGLNWKLNRQHFDR